MSNNCVGGAATPTTDRSLAMQEEVVPVNAGQMKLSMRVQICKTDQGFERLNQSLMQLKESLVSTLELIKMDLKDEQVILERGIEHLFHIDFSSEDGLVIDQLSLPQGDSSRSGGDSLIQNSQRSSNNIMDSRRSTKSDKNGKRQSKEGNISQRSLIKLKAMQDIESYEANKAKPDEKQGRLCGNSCGEAHCLLF